MLREIDDSLMLHPILSLSHNYLEWSCIDNSLMDEEDFDDFEEATYTEAQT